MTLVKKHSLFFSSFIAMLGTLFPSFWILVPLGLALFFYHLWQRTTSALQALLHGLFFGFVTAGSSIIWFWATLPIDWLPHEPLVQFLAVGIVWVYVSLALALGTAFIAPFFFLVRQSPFWLLPILGSALWIFQEMMRMQLYSVATAGSGTLYGAHFSVSAFGYALAESTHFLQFATLGGVYALSAAVAFFAGCIFLVTNPRTRTAGLVGILVMVGAPFFIPQNTSPMFPQTTIAVATVQDRQTEETLPQHLKRVASTDVVVFPEGTVPGETNLDALLIYSTYIANTTLGGIAEVHYQRGAEQNTYKKRLLMPLGEYVPYLTQAVLGFLPSSRLQQRIQTPENQFFSGTEPARAFVHEGVSFGTLLCSENVSPVLYRNLGANVLVNLSNITWFHGNKRVADMLYTIAKVHAVQNNAYFVLASKGGYSFVLNPDGEEIIRSDGATGIISTTLPIPH